MPTASHFLVNLHGSMGARCTNHLRKHADTLHWHKHFVYCSSQFECLRQYTRRVARPTKISPLNSFQYIISHLSFTRAPHAARNAPTHTGTARARRKPSCDMRSGLATHPHTSRGPPWAWVVARIKEPSPAQTRVTRLVADRSTCLVQEARNPVEVGIKP